VVKELINVEASVVEVSSAAADSTVVWVSVTVKPEVVSSSPVVAEPTDDKTSVEEVDMVTEDSTFVSDLVALRVSWEVKLEVAVADSDVVVSTSLLNDVGRGWGAQA